MKQDFNNDAKIFILLILIFFFITYSLIVYFNATKSQTEITLSEKASAGKTIWQDKNCSSCHQVFGLGGYLGPELTKTMSDPHKSLIYVRAILKTGTQRMPNFNLSEKQIDCIIEYLQCVDSAATIVNNK